MHLRDGRGGAEPGSGGSNETMAFPLL